MNPDKKQPDFPWLMNYDSSVPYSIDYPDITVHEILDAAALINPERVCLVFEDKEYTYAQIQQGSLEISRKLVDMGVRIGDRVGLILQNSPSFVKYYFAILRAGAIVTAINPFSTEHEIHFQFKDAEVSCVIGALSNYKMLMDATRDLRINIIILEKDLSSCLTSDIKIYVKEKGQNRFKIRHSNDFESIGQQPEVNPNQPAIFQYSGGTTGTPKAAIGTHKGLVANIFQFSVWLTSLEVGKETWLSAIPFYHIYGMIIGLCVGIQKLATLIILPDARDIPVIVHSAVKYKATFLPAVPAMFSVMTRFIEDNGYSQDDFSIKACISGSASLHEKIKHRFEELTGSRIMEGYGLSEAPTATHCNPLQGENRIGSIGLPLQDVVCKIVDIESGSRSVPLGEPGELVIKGPQVMSGYHNQIDDLQVLQDGWLFTGDIARMDDDGYFYIIDRKKDLIKIGGFQVWPKEVETRLMQHPAVAEAAVVGKVRSSDSSEMIHAWVVLNPGMETSGIELKTWCGLTLSRYKIPKHVHFIDRLPKTTVGKILRRELRADP
jgi:long-chain acyl-CoA synthetase